MCRHSWLFYYKELIIVRVTSHEDFLEWLRENYPDYTVVDGIYKTSKQKLTFQCGKCGNVWQTTSHNLHHHHGCAVCSATDRGQAQKHTHNWFIEQMHNKHPDIKVLGVYSGLKNKLLCECTTCGWHWRPTPTNLLQGAGCPKCGRARASSKCTKTHEQFLEEVQRVNPDIEVIGRYVNSQTSITVRCLLDGHIWNVSPGSLLDGHRCPVCAKTARLTYDVFMSRMKDMHPTIAVSGPYVDAQTKVQCTCLVDGYTWKTKPSGLMSGYGCRMCGYRKVGDLNSLSQQDFCDRLAESQLFELVGTYTTLTTPTTFRCKCCGEIWEDQPKRVLRRKNCPKACSTTGERLVMDYLDRNKIVYHREFRLPGCKAKKELYFDFYLPEQRCVIEYDGQQHFMPVTFSGMDDEAALHLFQTNVWRDKIKDRYCEQHNILMIRIPYTEADHIEQILDEQLLKRMEAHFWCCWSYRNSDAAWRYPYDGS